ncbi:MAG TPA: carboxypeptidase-like regulatory domain-containing protein [Pyrinomonadaceae bacterium]|nr:carboxypeptidase-like regulatory domain-containing protein [Pyrinomonadaceae bacterium]
MIRKNYGFLTNARVQRSFILRGFLVCAFLFAFSVAGKAVTLWQNTNTTTITANNSISCNLAGNTYNNSYWRAFTPSSFGESGTFTVSSVQIGIEEAVAPSGSQPLTVNIYTNTGGAFPAGTRTLIGTTNATVANGTLFFQTVAVAAAPQLVTTQLAVEIVIPDGTSANIRFFIGSNALGQTAPSYISAVACGAANPTNVANVGAPNMHSLIGLTGNSVATAADSSISGKASTAEGNGIRGALVTLTLPNGETRSTITGAFGNYRFDALETGQTYILSINAKRYNFANPTRIITLNQELTGEDFTAADY